LAEPQPVYDEFYPWIEGGIDVYFKEYLESPASVLFMLGPPGTGKTSLIRHFIAISGMNAMVTYEDALLSTDSMFVEFLTSGSDCVLVVEDADIMLSSRDHTGNALVARFLNVSEGLVKVAGKKVIFTTNLSDFNNVDEALVRPGRCFDAMSFRALSHSESKAASRVAGLPVPLAQEPHTLAQIFNQRQKSSPIGRKAGFRSATRRD
jgi:SpoVK/Ycf46/Vps4 family AAA+-type ATPase